MALAKVMINWVFSNSVGGFTDNFVSSFLSVCLESHGSMRWTWWTLNYYLPFPVVLLGMIPVLRRHGLIKRWSATCFFFLTLTAA